MSNKSYSVREECFYRYYDPECQGAFRGESNDYDVCGWIMSEFAKGLDGTWTETRYAVERDARSTKAMIIWKRVEDDICDDKGNVLWEGTKSKSKRKAEEAANGESTSKEQKIE